MTRITRGEIFNISEKIDRLFELITPQQSIPKEITTVTRISQEKIVGRKEDIEKVRASLLERGETALINGLGGIGKTTLASVYADMFYEDYSFMLWLTIKNSLQEAMVANYSLLENLNLKDIPADHLVEACLNKLRNLQDEKPGAVHFG